MILEGKEASGKGMSALEYAERGREFFKAAFDGSPEPPKYNFGMASTFLGPAVYHKEPSTRVTVGDVGRLLISQIAIGVHPTSERSQRVATVKTLEERADDHLGVKAGDRSLACISLGIHYFEAGQYSLSGAKFDQAIAIIDTGEVHALHALSLKLSRQKGSFVALKKAGNSNPALGSYATAVLEDLAGHHKVAINAAQRAISEVDRNLWTSRFIAALSKRVLDKYNIEDVESVLPPEDDFTKRDIDRFSRLERIKKRKRKIGIGCQYERK